MLGVIQEQRRDFDESAAAFQRAVHLSPHDAAHARRARPHLRALGPPELAVEMLRKLEAYAKERYVSPVEFAWI